MKKLSSAFLDHREVSAQEAAYRLLSLPLKKATRKVIFVNTNSKDKRICMKHNHVLQDLDDDSRDLYQKSLIDQYTARPQALGDLCLAELAANYTNDYRDTGNENTEDHQLEPVADDQSTTPNGSGCKK